MGRSLPAAPAAGSPLRVPDRNPGARGAPALGRGPSAFPWPEEEPRSGRPEASRARLRGGRPRGHHRGTRLLRGRRPWPSRGSHGWGWPSRHGPLARRLTHRGNRRLDGARSPVNVRPRTPSSPHCRWGGEPLRLLSAQHAWPWRGWAAHTWPGSAELGPTLGLHGGSHAPHLARLTRLRRHEAARSACVRR